MEGRDEGRRTGWREGGREVALHLHTFCGLRGGKMLYTKPKNRLIARPVSFTWLRLTLEQVSTRNTPPKTPLLLTATKCPRKNSSELPATTADPLLPVNLTNTQHKHKKWSSFWARLKFPGFTQFRLNRCHVYIPSNISERQLMPQKHCSMWPRSLSGAVQSCIAPAQVRRIKPR